VKALGDAERDQRCWRSQSYFTARSDTSTPGYPANQARLCLPVAGSAAKLGPQTTFDESLQWLAKLSCPLLRRNEQVIWQINGDLHTESIFPNL
jgi:hypothetical protein